MSDETVHTHRPQYVHATYSLGFKMPNWPAVRQRWPATRWDCFKANWFPAWAKRRWPVRYVTIEGCLKAAQVRIQREIDREMYAGLADARPL